MASARIRCRVAAIGLIGAVLIALLPRVTNAAASTPRPASAMQPLEILPSGHIVVAVGIDGATRRRFILDTGASATAIFPRLRAELPALAAQRAEEFVDGVAGRSKVETTVVGRLDVAGRVFRARKLLLLPPGPGDRLGVDGILGADILSGHVVDIDMAGRRWRMARSVEPATLVGPAATAPFVLDEHRAPRLTARLAGVAMPAILDTGARDTIINRAAAKAIGLSTDSAELTSGPAIRGATVHAIDSFGARLDSIGIGGASISRPAVRIADLPIFPVLGFRPDQPAVVLGIDLFADRRVLIDHPGRRLHISPPAGPAASNP